MISLKEAIEKYNADSEEGQSIIMSGIEVLDSVTKGWMPGELYIFGARPVMGKTAFVLSCISNIVADGTPVALFSSSDSLSERFLSRVLSAMTGVRQPIGDVPLYLCLQHDLTLSYIRNDIEALVHEKDVHCVFIETIQSVFVSEENGNTREGMERICHELKNMAIEFNIPIVMTSELNRSTEYREGFEGKKPQMSDLRSSSAIEQEADSVYLFWRPEYYGILEDNYHNDLHGIGEIIIAKNSNGSIGSVRVKMDSTGLIEDMCGNHKRKRLQHLGRQIPVPVERKEIGEEDLKRLVESNPNLAQLFNTFDLERSTAQESDQRELDYGYYYDYPF